MSSYVKLGLWGAVFFGMEFPLNTALAAAEPVEPWVYDSILQLAADGYLELPERSLGSYSRQELSGMVAQALTEMEKQRTGNIVDEYARMSRLVVMDEVQLKLFEEQAAKANDLYEEAQNKASRAAELYLRRSMLGQNRLEVMKPLKEKNDLAQEKLELAARDYAEAQSRVAQRKKMLAYAKQKQQDLLKAMSGEKADNGLAEVTAAGAGNLQAVSRASLEAAQNVLSEAAAEHVPAALDNAGRLRAEFLPELEEGGDTDAYNARQQLSSNIPIADMPEQRLKVDTELRLDSGHSDGEHGGDTRTRIRARVYPDYDIDGNWHAKGMLEAEKFISGANSSDDAHAKIDRYYLSGKIGTFHTDAGVFGNMMAEGNIYDSKYKGVRLSTTDTPIKYTVEYGNLGYDDAQRSYDLLASYQGPDYRVDAGYYNFDYHNDIAQHVYMGSYRHNLGIFDLGGMLLYGKQDNAGGKTGYVLSLGYNPQDSWRPYTWQSWLKYYYQPAATYVSHTMNGVADYMKMHGGFKGVGLGFNYTLPDNWALGLEFYSLSDLDYGHRSNTIWGSLTKTFKNYSE